MRNGNLFEENPKKTILVMLLVTVSVADLVATNLYTRYLSKQKQVTEDIEQSYRIQSEIYHHDLAKKFVSESAMWGGKKYTIATDSLGFKSLQARDVPLVSSNYRIVFIGDSFTEGVGVEYSDTFVGRIADQLSSDNIEVLNAAVSSYSPIIYYRKVQYLISNVGLKFDELVVYVDISDIQDEAIHYEMSRGNTVIRKERKKHGEHEEVGVASGIKGKIKANFILISYVLKRVKTSLGEWKKEPDIAKVEGIGRRDINRNRSLWTVNEDVYEYYAIEGLNNSKHHMDLLHKLLEKHDIKMSIAVYPWPDQIVNNDLDSIQVAYWKNWAEKNKVKFLNYFPSFIKEDCDRDCSYEILENYFIRGDVHWNENGHDLIAKKFMKFYKEM